MLRPTPGLNVTSFRQLVTGKPHVRLHQPRILLHRTSQRACAQASGASPAPAQPRSFSSCLELYVISDLHCDYPDNLRWVEQLAANRAGAAAAGDEEEGSGRAGAALEVQSVLIVAGDISDCLHTIGKTLHLLKTCFWQVFFVPGNHELWVTGAAERHGGASDSCEKLLRVLELCRELGVLVTPQLLGPDLMLAPLLSWHHKTFDREPDIPGIPNAGSMTIADYAKCRWPEPLTGPEGHGGLQLAEWVDSLNCPVDALMNNRPQGAPELQVISFSHFVPDQRLVPEKRYLSYPNLVKAVGSDPLRSRLQALTPIAHVFGHTHFAWDAVLEDGVRYVQAPLCYPLERKGRHKSIVLSSTWQPGQDQVQQQQEQQEQRAVWERLAGAAQQQAQEQAQRPEGREMGRQRQAASDGDEPAEEQYGGGDGSQADEPDEAQWLSSVQHPHPPAWLPLLLYRARYNVQIKRPPTPQDPVLAPLAAGSPRPQADSGHLPGERGDGPGPAAMRGPPHGEPGSLHLDMLSRFWRENLVSEMGPGSSAEIVIGDWEGRLCPSLGGAMWSRFYKLYSRTPDKLELAPWVAHLYERRLSRTKAQQDV